MRIPIIGFSPIDVLKTRDGRAPTTCSIFIDPINGIRKTLTVWTYAEATRVLFSGNVATGVEYSRFGKKLNVGARRDVVLSAGAYGSPLLLFKSGIGPAKMLSNAHVCFLYSISLQSALT